MAETKAKAKTKAKTNTEDYYKEKVKVFVPQPPGVKDNSCTITVNGKNYQIMYDCEVEVPRFVALVIDESKRNEKIADKHIEKAMKAQQLGEF